MITCKKVVSGTTVTRSISMRIYFADCSNRNLLCNNSSSAYLPAITLCIQDIV